MNFNKWTLALAGIGVISLAAVSQAEQKVSAVQSVISSTTISGYVDTSAHWNLGTDNENMPPYRFGDVNKADGFNLNVVQLSLARPLDESDWAAGYKVDLWLGPDANTLATQSSFGEGSSDFAIRQAYVALRMPVGNGLDWKVGVFDSVIGYESIESGNNPNYTRSYGNTIEPTTHTGVLLTYRFNDWFSAAAGVANTHGPQINSKAHFSSDYDKAESYKAYMGSIAFTAPDSWGWAAGSTLYGGVVNGYNDDPIIRDVTTSWYVGGTLATPLPGLKVGAAFDYLNFPNAPLYDYTWSLAGYASYQATERLSFHARVEYVEDRYDFLDVFFTEDRLKIWAFTGTVQYDLWKNVISRLEVRWDHSGIGEIFGPPEYDQIGNRVSNSEADAVLIAANIIFKF